MVTRCWRFNFYRCICSSWNHPVSCLFALEPLPSIQPPRKRYLLDGNVLAARSFLTEFLSLIQTMEPPVISILPPSPIAITLNGSEPADEVIFTTEPVLNFLQLALRTCQRAEGDRNKQARDAWIKLCSTYLSKGGALAQPDVRKVSNIASMTLLSV